MEDWEKTIEKFKKAKPEDGRYSIENVHFPSGNTWEVVTNVINDTLRRVSPRTARRLASKLDNIFRSQKTFIPALNDDFRSSQCEKVLAQLQDRFIEDTLQLLIPRNVKELRDDPQFKQLIGGGKALKIMPKPGEPGSALALDLHGNVAGELDISDASESKVGNFAGNRLRLHRTTKQPPGISYTKSFDGGNIVFLCFSHKMQRPIAPADRGGGELFHEIDHAEEYLADLALALAKRDRPHEKFKNELEAPAVKVENEIYQDTLLSGLNGVLFQKS